MLLTTRVVESRGGMPDGILAGDGAFGQGGAERVAVELGHPDGLAQRKPAVGAKAAGEFNTFAYTHSERTRGHLGTAGPTSEVAERPKHPGLVRVASFGGRRLRPS